MGNLYPVAPLRASAHSASRNRNVAHHLKRYHRRYRKHIFATAQRHSALADLSISFPALLFVCAVNHPGVDRLALQSRVIEGWSLKSLAALARIPFWVRKLPPEAFGEVIGCLPSSEFSSKRIANLLPKKVAQAAKWTRIVSRATELCDEGFALWVARIGAGEIPRRCEPELHSLALWAWYSQRQVGLASELILQKWHPGISWGHALDASDCWMSSLDLFLKLGHGALHYNRHATRHIGEVEFVPLQSARQIHDEVKVSQNCIRDYGYCLAMRDKRLISVHRKGESIAILCLSEGRGQRRLTIEELRAPRNGGVSNELAETVRTWLNAQDPLLLQSDMGPFQSKHCGRVWREIWKPYWLAKGTKTGLPLVEQESTLRDLRWP